MCLITCGIIHQVHEWFSDDSRGRQEIFLCLAALLCEQFCRRFANGGVKIYRSSFLRVFSSSEVLGKIVSIQSKLPTAVCWSRE